MSDTDFSQRFMLSDSDVRGELVYLEQSYARVLARHDYPPVVAALLGEMMAAAGLLVGTIKFDGLLTMQVRSAGALSLLMVECSSEREVRAIARYEAEQLGDSIALRELMPDGVLAITMEPEQGQRYQGLVGLDGDSLARCLENYFASSEQLPSFFMLHADGRRARGMMLQQLPATNKDADAALREDSWQHVLTLARTLRADELMGLGNQEILHRLYHEEDISLFAEQSLRFKCSCSRERSTNALLSLGEQDVLQLLDEQQGRIEVDCQFCNERYIFDAENITKIFQKQLDNNGLSVVH